LRKDYARVTRSLTRLERTPSSARRKDAERISQASRLAVTIGASGQKNVIDVVPGQRGYTPLWRVSVVTWADGVTPRLLKSASEVRKAASAGDVTVRRTDMVVNCPVI
jgi:hypothetical protein